MVKCRANLALAPAHVSEFLSLPSLSPSLLVVEPGPSDPIRCQFGSVQLLFVGSLLALVLSFDQVRRARVTQFIRLAHSSQLGLLIIYWLVP